jgi:hypothetical protein
MAWTDTNWKAESAKAAAYAAEHNATEGPVGIMRWGPPGTIAVYGRIGESAVERARSLHTAEVARSLLANANVEVLAAGLDQQRQAWTILVESDAIDFLDAMVSEAWQIAEVMVGT